ncbi:MAG TPA: pyridoxamine 5'-phosphate oxidase family protein [Actinomycetota bacterium]|nr:pyridoxamine 5'-phosphate oxidase family protein [Actinomycetota bacterium]
MNPTEARRTFGDVRVAHVATVDLSGAPHVVPLWFVWLEDGLFVTCRSGSRTVRNLRRDPRVAVELDRGRTWADAACLVVHGRAELLPPTHPDGRRALSAWFEKYREELSGQSFALYAQEVEDPVLLRVRTDRLTAWLGGRGRPARPD